MKENVKIEPLTDFFQLEEIEKIEKNNFKNTAFSMRVLEELYYDERVIILVGIFQNCISGYVILYNNEDIYDILKIAVKNEFKRKSIGTKLLDYINNNLIKNRKISIMLEVRENNQRAINFYEKYGFQKISIRKKYYEDTDEDANIMIYSKN
ncbi:ribosomal protein S18-alanine N-acetyltransferase [Fusobacterium sp. PH5-44]|uniref:ribosomal protein S18-alanine N-acetyltransferase n=1 Tax=unclassified Fusobacterium TaxID=2648384 RepID=UPI003D1E3455